MFKLRCKPDVVSRGTVFDYSHLFAENRMANNVQVLFLELYHWHVPFLLLLSSRSNHLQSFPAFPFSLSSSPACLLDFGVTLFER